MREAGAVILGKTTMPDYGMLSSGLSSFHALARNPWDLSKGPGGSSAGAGAAVAAGYGPLHVGTDIGGSLRLPAAWCGIFTLKPSLGRIPIDPPYAGRCAGPMTRSVADAALLMSVLARPDERDTMSLPPADIAWSRLERDVRGLQDRPAARPRRRPAGRSRDRRARCGPPPSASPPPAPRSRRSAPTSPAPCSTAWTRSGGCAPGSTSRRCRAERRAKVLPFIARWIEGGAEAERRRGVPRLQPDGRDARGRGRRASALRRRAVADRADPRLRRRARLADRRSGAAARAHLLHRRLQHERAAGGEHQLRLDPRRPADRPADRRQAPRRPRRAPGRGRLGGDAAGAAALARAAAAAAT